MAGTQDEIQEVNHNEKGKLDETYTTQTHQLTICRYQDYSEMSGRRNLRLISHFDLNHFTSLFCENKKTKM